MKTKMQFYNWRLANAIYQHKNNCDADPNRSIYLSRILPLTSILIFVLVRGTMRE